VDGERDLAEVSGGDNLAGMRAADLQHRVSGTPQREVASFGLRARHDVTVFGVARSRMEYPVRKGPRQSRISAVVAGAGLIGRHLRRDYDKGLMAATCRL